MEQRPSNNVVSSQAQAVTTIEAPGTSISDAINAATIRKHHVRLNQIILRRLPLALPPRASDPSIYGQGIAAFAQIYFAFEQVWTEVTASTNGDDDQSHEAQLRKWLASLRPTGLPRTERLKVDIRHIEQRTGIDLRSASCAQERLIRRMRQSLREKPHTLVAYAWVMYMALYSGGRHIRIAFRLAGPDFWMGTKGRSLTEYIAPEKGLHRSADYPGFSFLCFDDERDGIAIEREFKSRLAEAETLLAQHERDDIVAAAVGLFDDCIALVGILDREVTTRICWSRCLNALLSIFPLTTIMFLLWIAFRCWKD